MQAEIIIQLQIVVKIALSKLKYLKFIALIKISIWCTIFAGLWLHTYKLKFGEDNTRFRHKLNNLQPQDLQGFQEVSRLGFKFIFKYLVGWEQKYNNRKNWLIYNPMKSWILTLSAGIFITAQNYTCLSLSYEQLWKRC